MAIQIKEELLVLGFNIEDGGFELPKMTEINRSFRKLARKTHSDKGGEDEEFIKVYNAWKTICDFYNNLPNEEIQKYGDGIDEEEEIARQDFNICKQNKSSFTIFIENELSFLWDDILENRYGKGEDKDIHGIHWTHKNYAFEDLSGSDIFLRKYHMPKNDKSSKIVIQGKFDYVVAYVTDELPKVYKQVHKVRKKAIVGDIDDISLKLKVLDIQKACGHCDFKTLQKVEFDEHMKINHQDKVQEISEDIDGQETSLQM